MKRINRHYRRAERKERKVVGINLVSLMDIFTILVFFLLVNSSDVETLSNNDAVKLPESISEEKPRETILIVVNESDILVQGQKISNVAEILKNDSSIIESLKKELEHHASRGEQIAETGQAFAGAVTIMGDKEIPYRLLKKIMVTCAESHFGNISLAVQQKAKG
ncbi:MAG: biopolymer transporter ExbD [Gammaproteobacteria bacterium]|nr:biopolymer transporter ExbD [Gammaproteobacteria bacterium]